MTQLGHLIDRMIAAGMSPGAAGAVAAEIYAAGVASASVRSPGAERTRRWRHKASQSVTERHANETSPNVTERHKASHCDANAVLPIDTKIKNSKRQNSNRPSRGSRIEPDWAPSPAERDFAKQEGFSESELEREAARFRDYWGAKAGAGGVKLDWKLTWQNWIRTSADRLGKSPKRAAGEDNSGLYLAKFGSEELSAWDDYTRAKTGKTLPRDRDGNWRVPARWPPGYSPAQHNQQSPPPNLRAMQ